MVEKPYYHAGVAVPDLEAAMEELGSQLGLEWGEINDLRIGDWPVRCVFNTDGPPFIELIEGPPKTTWDATEGPRLHHLGWWEDDRAGAKERLAASGVAPEVDGGGMGRLFDYYQLPLSGVRIELVDATNAKAREILGL